MILPSNDLIDFLKEETNALAREYERIGKRVKEDPGTAGDEGEQNWASILRKWLPQSLHIVTKGRILAANGDASPQVDVLVLSDAYPPHLVDKKLYIAGGVLAAFECKRNVRRADLKKFFKNSIAIKSLLPVREGSPASELQVPLLYGLLSHSHELNVQSQSNFGHAEQILQAQVDEFVTLPRQFPDTVCIADLGFWSATKMIMFNSYNIETRASLVGFNPDDVTQSTDFTPVGAFVASLTAKLADQVISLRPLSEYYQKVDVQGNGKGISKNFGTEGLSSSVINGVNQGKLKNGVLWDPWRMVIA